VLLPPGVTALAGLPGEGPLTVNGQPVSSTPLATRRGRYQTVELPPGEHRLRMAHRAG